MIGHKLIAGKFSTIGASVSPTIRQNDEYKMLISRESLKNLIANGTVPISFSSRIPEGM